MNVMSKLLSVEQAARLPSNVATLLEGDCPSLTIDHIYVEFYASVSSLMTTCICNSVCHMVSLSA